jgi:23S rRNA pseudouridine2605 synthase
VRLNRYIATCGVASRRGADKLIAEGKVTVNGEYVTTMGPDINEKRDVVRIEGKEIRLQTNDVYIMLNKPAGYICSCSDDRGRKTVLDLIDGIGERIFPVGRLDYDTEGLLILTSDGDFAYRCTHPKHEISKKYVAEVEGSLSESVLRALREGVVVDGRKTSPAGVDVIEHKGGLSKLHVTIHEGRNRQVKKMFEAVGCRVAHLKRIAIGELELGSLAPGAWRRLEDSDLKRLGAMKNSLE